MAEEFMPDQNNKAESRPGQADPGDLKVSGQHKSHKRKRTSPLYPVIIAVLLCVMGYSGYQIASTLIRNHKADSVYEDIANQYIMEDDPTEQPVPTEPSPTETSPSETSGEPQNTEESGQPHETEESAALITVEDDPETTPAPTVPKPTAAPSDPMRILNVNFTSLKQANSDVIAWLQGLGGAVNYPVVQGNDNAYYLTHLFDRTANANGTLFVHSENKFLQDDVTFIFGHHMRSGKMFGRLTDYESSSFYYNNPVFRLYTPGRTYTLKIYAVVRGVGTERITLNYADEAAFNRAMQTYASRSLHPASVPVYYGDKIVCLCTCSRHIDDGRFFIYCKVMDP